MHFFLHQKCLRSYCVPIPSIFNLRYLFLPVVFIFSLSCTCCPHVLQPLRGVDVLLHLMLISWFMIVLSNALLTALDSLNHNLGHGPWALESLLVLNW